MSLPFSPYNSSVESFTWFERHLNCTGSLEIYISQKIYICNLKLITFGPITNKLMVKNILIFITILLLQWYLVLIEVDALLDLVYLQCKASVSILYSLTFRLSICGDMSTEIGCASANTMSHNTQLKINWQSNRTWPIFFWHSANTIYHHEMTAVWSWVVSSLYKHVDIDHRENYFGSPVSKEKEIIKRWLSLPINYKSNTVKYTYTCTTYSLLIHPSTVDQYSTDWCLEYTRFPLFTCTIILYLRN